MEASTIFSTLKKQVFENTYILIRPGILELIVLSENEGVYSFVSVAKFISSELPTFLDVFSSAVDEIFNGKHTSEKNIINLESSKCYINTEKQICIENQLGNGKISFPTLQHVYVFCYQVQSCILASLFESQNRKKVIVNVTELLVNRHKSEGESKAKTLLEAWSNDVDLNLELYNFCVENQITNAQDVNLTISFCFLHSDIIEALYGLKKIQMCFISAPKP